MEDAQQLSAAFARPRRVSEVRVGDERVRLVGLVTDKRETDFTLDDGTGRLTVIFDDPSLADSVSIGSKVRVFGTPLTISGASELHAEIVQKMDGLDLGLHDSVRREVEKTQRELGRAW